MMDEIDEDFIKIARNYFSEEELEDICFALTHELDEYLDKKFNLGKVVSEQQSVSAMVHPVSNSLDADGFPICHVDLKSSYWKTERVSVSLTLDGIIILQKQIDLDSNELVSEVFRHPNPESIRNGYKGNCIVIVSDSFNRVLSRSEFSIRFTSVKKSIVHGANIAIDGYPVEGEDAVCLATIELSSEGDEAICIISAYADSRKLVSRTITIPSNESIVKKLTLDSRAYPDESRFNLRVVVESDGKVVCESSGVINRPVSLNPNMTNTDNRYCADAKPTDKSVFADCTVAEMVDVHDVVDNCVIVGVAVIDNKSRTHQAVSFDLVLDGDVILKKNIDVKSEGKEVVPFAMPTGVLYREDTTKSNVECHVYDSEGLLVMARVFTTTIRSKYDLCLNEIELRTSQFVNPLDPAIKKIVVPKDGAVAKAMMKSYGKFSISGYQSRDGPNILMKCAYDAIRDMQLSYVSDTFTMRTSDELSKGKYYQRVRTPQKVLKDRSGNCFELSVLFASIFESMGLEPVVIFPPGHAIVGVVVSTNNYGSTTKGGSFTGFPCKPLKISCGGTQYFEAIFLESTMCACKNSTYEDAVKSAHDTIKEARVSIEKERDYSLVSKYHRKGVTPGVI